MSQVPMNYPPHSTPNDLGIKRGTYIPLEGGWKEDTVYVVDVAFRSTNPIHRTLLRIGFHGSDSPLTGNYTGFLTTYQEWESDGKEFSRPGFAYFIRAISEVEGLADPMDNTEDWGDDDNA